MDYINGGRNRESIEREKESSFTRDQRETLMGEAQEEKKPEETKMEEKKPEEPKNEEGAKTEDKKQDEKKSDEAPPPPPPPQEIILRVYMHCEGCAKKVRRCLRGFPGIEDVLTDCKTHKVVVKGEKADPLKVLERVQKKSHRQVELLSPIPKPPSAAEEPKKAEEKEPPKPEEPKEVPQVIIVALKVHMHCEACAQEIKRRILRMKGVEKVDADLKISQVTVTGIFDPPKLLEYVYKRTGKQAVILKQEPEKKEEGEKAAAKEENKGGEAAAEAVPVPAAAVEEEKKGGGDGGGGGDETKEKKEGGDTAVPAAADGEGDAGKVVEVKKNEFYYYYPTNFQIYPPRFATEMYSTHPGYAPQMFSDENPNACSVM